MTRESILVVDDEPGVRSTLQAILGDEGYRVTTVGSGEDGLTEASAGTYDAVLLDVWLPGIDGLETLTQVKARGIDAEVVMISGHGTIDTAVKATKLGAFDFVEKPLSLEKTLLVLRNALRQRRLEKRTRALLTRLARDTEILGESDAIERVRREAAAAASTDAPVLVCGEAGSGRETVARHIHAAGRRADQALVHVACAAPGGATDQGLLFGAPGRPGRLDLAGGGTLILEDVDTLPSGIQTALAGWLSGEPDVRVMATAGPEPSGLRSPLRERLDVVRISTVPLRDRREDVAFLAVRFLHDLAREYARPVKSFAPDAMAALRQHDWPGNVRALRNVVERSLLLSPSSVIRLSDLPSELGGAVPPAIDLYAPFPSLAEGVAAFTAHFLRRALRDAQGDVEVAARRAGISVEELNRLLA